MQCFSFPRQIIFFLRAHFEARYLGYELQLPHIDTYFLLNCTQPGAHDGKGKKHKDKGGDEETVSEEDASPYGADGRYRSSGGSLSELVLDGVAGDSGAGGAESGSANGGVEWHSGKIGKSKSGTSRSGPGSVSGIGLAEEVAARRLLRVG